MTTNPYSPPAAAPPYGAVADPALAGGGDVGAVSSNAIELLRQTRPWVLFLCVLCFLGCGFMALAGVSMVLIGLVAPRPSGGSPIPPWVLGLVYLPFSALYIYPALKLGAYAKAIGKLVLSRSNADLEGALAQQKSFWKFSGIAAIVMIVLYFVAIVGAVVVGVAAALHGPR